VRTLVLFNGGLKDTFLATLAKKEGMAILCYIELRAGVTRPRKMMQLVEKLDLPLVTISLRESPPLEEVLLRMLYLTLFVLPLAKEKQCKRIYHGLSRDDDLRVVPVIDAFVKQLNSLMELGQPLYDGKGFWLGNVSVETPLRCLDRARTIRLGNEWDTPWELTHSCSVFSTKHCGRCKNCLRRKKAFKREGCFDPTYYKEQ